MASPSVEDVLLDRGGAPADPVDRARGLTPVARLGEPGTAGEDAGLPARSASLGVPAISLADPGLTLRRVTDAFPLRFMQQYVFFPLALENGTLTVVMRDPGDVETVDNIRLQAGGEVRVLLGGEREILRALEEHYGASSSIDRIVQDIAEDGEPAEGGSEDVAQLKDLASEAPVIRLVNLLIARAAEVRASDIHIEPFEESLRVRYRVDGVLVNTEAPPKRLQAAVISRIKLMARMNIAERRLPQDGRIRTGAGGAELDIRVSTIPTIYGESVVMRLLDRASTLPDLDGLGFPEEAARTFRGLIRKPHGILLVTGPTGSGKTTTLYAALRSINAVEKKIITIEDPVEYQLDGITQIQVKPRIGLTFAAGLRHIVRQDPDVILVGEIRDRETAEIAIHAALTGHLVLSTLHTNDAAGAITRLLDMGIENYLVSSTLLAVLAQRLVRRICVACKTEYAPSAEVLKDLPPETRRLRLFKGNGCPSCTGTGYSGRLGIFELLVMDDPLQRLILAKGDAGSIRADAVARGMTTLWQDGCRKVAAGITTPEEVLRVTREN
ncbi:MAG: type II secretion system ATPase GspE [Candidatus Methylomirabilales bacterium]